MRIAAVATPPGRIASTLSSLLRKKARPASHSALVTTPSLLPSFIAIAVGQDKKLQARPSLLPGAGEISGSHAKTVRVRKAYIAMVATFVF